MQNLSILSGKKSSRKNLKKLETKIKDQNGFVVLKSMPNSQDAKAKQILEINPNHELFTTLETLYLNDKNSVEKYAKILYNQALLIEGLPLENPVEFSNLMIELMIQKNK